MNNFSFNFNVKSLEKLGLYLVGILTQTGVFHVTPAGKEWLTASVAAVIAALHISTPASPKA